MRLINAKHYKSIFFLLAAVLWPISASYAEWIQAKPIGASNDIWVNTESNALYSGDNCSPIMKLKHLRGSKPRTLRQRKQAFAKRLGRHSNASKQDQVKSANNAEQTKNGNAFPAVVGVNNQNARAAGIPVDSLDLSYQSQPEYDPLNRNHFNVSIDNTKILLVSQHFKINARISGRYDHRPKCGS
ncbi:MAG: hypothetical protein V3V18_16180 [Methylococcales bacterium]